MAKLSFTKAAGAAPKEAAPTVKPLATGIPAGAQPAKKLVVAAPVTKPTPPPPKEPEPAVAETPPVAEEVETAEGEEAGGEEAGGETEVVTEVAQTSHVALLQTAPQAGQGQGEVDQNDIVFPRLALTQSIGPLSETFDPGTFVLNGELPVSDPGPEAQGLEVTVVTYRKFYEEATEWGSGVIGKTFDTLAEVTAAGGWIEWVNQEKPPYYPVLAVLLAIACPAESLQDHFPFEHDGTLYAPAMYSLKGSGYTTFAKAILTAATVNLKDVGIHKAKWLLKSNREKRGANLVWVPRARRVGINDDETAQFLGSVCLG